MAVYLLKTEPDDYSYDDLVRDTRAEWDGVTNMAAQKFMRQVRKGDQAYIYHTGAEKRIAGLAKIVKGAYPDPDKPGQTAAGETKFVLFDLGPVRAAGQELTLADMKADERFAGFELLRQPRLSVMPVPEPFDRLIRELAGL